MLPYRAYSRLQRVHSKQFYWYTCIFTTWILNILLKVEPIKCICFILCTNDKRVCCGLFSRWVHSSMAIIHRRFVLYCTHSTSRARTWHVNNYMPMVPTLITETIILTLRSYNNTTSYASFRIGPLFIHKHGSKLMSTLS